MVKINLKNIIALLVAALGLIMEEMAWKVNMQPEWMNKFMLIAGFGLLIGGFVFLLYNSRTKRFRKGYK